MKSHTVFAISPLPHRRTKWLTAFLAILIAGGAFACGQENDQEKAQERDASFFQSQYGDYEADMSKAMPWQPALLPADKITPDMVKSMEAFDRCYPIPPVVPNGKGCDPKQLEQLVSDVQTLLPSDPDLPGPRKKMTFRDDPPEGYVSMRRELKPLLDRVLSAYRNAKPDQRAKIEGCYRRIIQAILAAKSFSMGESDPLVGGLGGGYSWRHWGQNFAKMDTTLPSIERTLLAESLAFHSGAVKLYREKPYTDGDLQLNLFYNAFRYIARMDNGPVKWQRLQALRRGLDLVAVQGRYITPDGGIIHHGGHHISYASYEFSSALQHQLNFTQAGILSPDSEEAIKNYRAACYAWGFTSLRGEFPVPMQLRPAPMWERNRGKGQKPGGTPHFAEKAARLTAQLHHTDPQDDLEMARIALSKTGGNRKLAPSLWKSLDDDKLTRPLEGHLAFPVMGASIHRRDDWMVVARGANVFFRGGEVYADANYPGAYLDHIMQGALFVYSGRKEGRFTNSVDSGFRTEGFNPNMFPGVTANMIPNADLAGRYYPDYLTGLGAAQGGGTELDGNGTWAWMPTQPPGVRQSVFFFDNRITLVARDIQVPGKDVRTTLLQQVHDDLESEPIFVDGQRQAGTIETELSGERSHTILDAFQTGYYLPPGNPTLKIVRGDQGYTYALPEQLKKGEDASILGKLKNRNQLRAALKHFDPIVRPVSLAYFQHGANPKNAAVRFTLLIRTTPQALDHFRQAMDGKGERPIELVAEKSFHLMYDRATRTWGLATFDQNASITPPPRAPDCDVLQVNRPATLMWHRDAPETMRLSIASTNLKDRTPFEIVLKGRWTLSPSPRFLVTHQEDRTLLKIAYRDQTPVHVTLKKGLVKGVSNQPDSQSTPGRKMDR